MILCLFGFFSGARKHPHNDMITETKDTAGNNHYQLLAVISSDYQLLSNTRDLHYAPRLWLAILENA
jgi:hypothetical protein